MQPPKVLRKGNINGAGIDAVNAHVRSAALRLAKIGDSASRCGRGRYELTFLDLARLLMRSFFLASKGDWELAPDNATAISVSPTTEALFLFR